MDCLCLYTVRARCKYYIEIYTFVIPKSRDWGRLIPGLVKRSQILGFGIPGWQSLHILHLMPLSIFLVFQGDL